MTREQMRLVLFKVSAANIVVILADGLPGN